ncbi:MAG: hypothetical protein KDA49_03860 [Rhodospirillaceae bacterium]|nr:hypothetical protein [Rhodospirillaceae bacterium]
MARYKDEEVVAALQPHLADGERLVNFAYGVRQPNIWVIFLLMLPAILPGAIAVTLMTKEYIVGLTDRRLIALRVKRRPPQVKEATAYDLASLPPSRARALGFFTYLWIDDEAAPFRAKFHRLGMKENRRHSREMAAALTGDQAFLAT